MDHDDRSTDTGMLGSDAENPGPGRDTSRTDPDPTAASSEHPTKTVGMSGSDPQRTRLGTQETSGRSLAGAPQSTAASGQETRAFRRNGPRISLRSSRQTGNPKPWTAASNTKTGSGRISPARQPNLAAVAAALRPSPDSGIRRPEATEIVLVAGSTDAW